VLPSDPFETSDDEGTGGVVSVSWNLEPLPLIVTGGSDARFEASCPTSAVVDVALDWAVSELWKRGGVSDLGTGDSISIVLSCGTASDLKIDTLEPESAWGWDTGTLALVSVLV